MDLNLALLGQLIRRGGCDHPAPVPRAAERGAGGAVDREHGRDAFNRELLPQTNEPRSIAGGAVEAQVALPTDFRLGEARPNPFDPRTMISFDLPRWVDVKLEIYDALGD